MDSLAPVFDPADLLPQKSFGYRLWMLRHAWTRRLEGAIDGTGLTHMQFFVLKALEHAARSDIVPSQTHLADSLHIDRMTVSKVVRTLEAKGFVARAVHPDDPRANSVATTPAGTSLVRQATRLVMDEQERFFGRLGEDRKQAFGVMLDDLLSQDGCRFGQEPE